MNFLFAIKEEYTVTQTPESVKNHMLKILNNKGGHPVENLAGYFKDGRFYLNKKWDWGSFTVLGELQEFSYLSGVLEHQNECTVIRISVRPNYVFPIIFYGMIALFLLELAGVHTLLKDKTIINLAFYACLILVSCSVMFIAPKSLKRRFEKYMIP